MTKNEATKNRGLKKEESSRVAASRKLCWPKRCVRITILPPKNKARIYLRSLGFKQSELWQSWHVKYCRRDPTSNPPVFDQIVVPFFDDANLLKRRKGPQWKFSGWQGLSPREAGSLEPPKGITPEGMAASGKLYGLKRAIPRGGPVVIVDSVVDVWRLGGNAISTFGEPMTHTQEDRIVALFRERPIVVATKSDKDEERQHVANRLTEKREALDDASLVQVLKLPTLDDVFEEWRRVAAWEQIQQLFN